MNRKHQVSTVEAGMRDVPAPVSFLYRAFPWLLLAPILLPLVIWGGLIYPYLVPKTLLFYTLSLLMLAAFGVLVAYAVPLYWSRLRQKETWIPLALLVLAYVASIAGLGFYRSFWSDFVRGDGLLMLSGVVLYFYLILLYADRSFFMRFLRAVAVVGTIVAVYGIGEWLLSGGRIGSLLGNAAFFAGYLGITVFATLADASGAPLQVRRTLFFAAAVQVVAIVLTATRGTMLALGVSVVVALGYVAVKGKGMHRKASTGTLLGLVLLGALFFMFRAQIAQMPFAPLARVASISTADPDVASRLFIWKHTLSAVAAHPLLGTGTEHIDVLFNTFYDPSQIQEQWFDRSHNAFLDYAVQYGIGGLLLYLALIASFFLAARRLRKQGEPLLAAAAALLAITYAVQNFFVFDTVSSFWLMLMLLALFLVRSGREVEKESLPMPTWSRALSFLFALVLVALIVPVAVRPAQAAYDLAQAYAYQLTNPSASAQFLTRGFALGTYGNLEYGYQAYDMYANSQHAYLKGAALKAAYETTLGILISEFNQYPYDARTALYLAHTITLAPTGTAQDQALLSKALTRAITESPKRSQPWYILMNLSITEANTYPASSKKRLAGYAAAEDLLKRYILLVPKLSEPHYVLADVLYASGDVAGARVEAGKGRQFYRGDVSTAKRAAGFYETVQDWVNAEFFLREVSVLDPSAYVYQYDLAKVEYLLGKKAAALLIVQKLRASDPGILPSDAHFLQAITAYESTQKPQ